MDSVTTETQPPTAAKRSRITSKEHIPVLDGVRAVAVIIVICFHFSQLFSSGPTTAIGKVAIWGQTGVDLFFVLSGFLITGILLDSKSSDHFLRNFYIRRILRIFPLYYLTLLAVFILCPLVHLSSWLPWKYSGWFWVYLQTVPMTFSASLPAGPNHFWSLGVEEHYYMFWPLLVRVLHRRKLLGAIALAVVISLATRIVFIDYSTFYFTFSRLDGLAIGSSLAIFARYRPEGLALLAMPAKVLLCSFSVILAGAQLVLSGTHLPVIQVFKSTLVALCYASAIILVIENQRSRFVARLLSNPAARSIGKYSYAMYVFQPFILSGLHRAGVPYSFTGLLLSILLIYIAAWASWVLVESRFLSLKRYFAYDANGSGG